MFYDLLPSLVTYISSQLLMTYFGVDVLMISINCLYKLLTKLRFASVNMGESIGPYGIYHKVLFFLLDVYLQFASILKSGVYNMCDALVCWF